MHVVVVAEGHTQSGSAATVAETIAAAWRGVRPQDQAAAVAMSSGGAGLLDAVSAAAPQSRRFTAEVANARGYASDVDWLQLRDGTAVIESAAACGIQQLPAEQRDIRLTTSYGVGQLISVAITAGAAAVLVGLGDSAAADGGAGLATALDHRLLRADGNRIKVGGRFLEQLERVERAAQPTVPIIALYDREILLTDAVAAVASALGAHAGADAATTQNGTATADLERDLARLADVVERDIAGGPWRDLPGSGAGGGMGFGLAAFAGASLSSGAQWFAEMVGLGDLLKAADTVVLATAGPTSAVAAEVRRLAANERCRVLDLTLHAGSDADTIAAVAKAAAAAAA